MNWTIMFYEKMRMEKRIKKDLETERTQKLLESFLKAKYENRILPKEYYKHFYLHYLESWTLVGHKEKKLRDVFNNCREMLIKHYKEDEKNLNQQEKKMNIKWGLTIDEGK